MEAAAILRERFQASSSNPVTMYGAQGDLKCNIRLSDLEQATIPAKILGGVVGRSVTAQLDGANSTALMLNWQNLPPLP